MAARAQPAPPLRIVVPYAAGGAADQAARLLAPELQKRLGQPVVVENRPGADGNIGTAEVASVGDGRTLLMGSLGTHAVKPLLSRRLPYDPVHDFAPVCLVATVPLVLVMNPATAQAHGVRRLADLLHFPYRSAASAQQDVIAGNMDLMFDTLPAALPQIQAGRLVALAVTSARRSPSLPALPTVEEAGGLALQGYEASAWLGLFAPSSLPIEPLTRLQQESVAALAGPALRARLTARGMLVHGSGAAELSALISAEMTKWARVIQLSGVQVDR